MRFMTLLCISPTDREEQVISLLERKDLLKVREKPKMFQVSDYIVALPHNPNHVFFSYTRKYP